MKIIKKIIAYIEIIRPLNVIITAAAVYGAALIAAQGNINWTDLLYAALAAALTAAAGNVINDRIDIKIDSVNRPWRPLPSNRIKPIEAKIFYLVLIHASFLLSGKVNTTVFVIVIAATNLLLLYSFFFKKIPLLGNITVSLLTGAVFIYGAAAVNNISAAVIPALFAFLINFIREIIKDMEDIEGDVSAGIKTFPAKFGFKYSKVVISLLSAILFLFTIFPYYNSLYKIEYFIIVMCLVNPIIVFMLKSLVVDDSKKNLGRLSGLVKLSMIIGLAAVVLGK